MPFPCSAAFQVTLENRRNFLVWPEWFSAALALSPDKVGAIFPITNAVPLIGEKDSEVYLGLRTLTGVHILQHTDWVVRSITLDSLFRVPDLRFRENYEIIKKA